MRSLYLLAFAFITTAQAQPPSADTGYKPLYRMPGFPEGTRLVPVQINDSTTIIEIRKPDYPPVRPTPPASYLKHLDPAFYKTSLKTYYQELRQFKEDSIHYLDHQKKIDSLQHILDSLKKSDPPILAGHIKKAGHLAGGPVIPVPGYPILSPLRRTVKRKDLFLA
jgi:hypothetical protein